MKSVTYDEEAALEAREAAEFYERRCAGLGRDFAAAVEFAVVRIQEAPRRWPRRTRNTRRYVLSK